MPKLSLSKMVCIVSMFCAVTAMPTLAQTFTTLATFNGTNGWGPGYETLIQGTDGNFYGTTFGVGGPNGNCTTNCGTIFKITPAGTLTSLHSFGGADGTTPQAGLVQGTDGNFYGTTYAGGANGYGTVFKITPGSTLTTLHSFNSTDGANPLAGLVQATDGNFYGTTAVGGVNGGYGTVFKITPGGTLTTLYSFDYTHGFSPFGGLVQATDGNFYGTTSSGGTNGDGTVFQITPGGTLTTLHSFGGTNGANPRAGLVQAADGNFYGTTSNGGTNNVAACASFGYAGCGTVFKITPGGTLTPLYSFDQTNGANPLAGLVQASDGNLYGTTSMGGASGGNGTVFEISAAGTLTTLHSFNTFAAGWVPFGGLLQATNGIFYGTTGSGGANGGTVFSLSVGLGPFVKTQPTSGAVGAAVIILGNNLTGASSVSFNGTAATFTVVSNSEIETTVPPGATTGIVQVTTPSGTLNSNVAFQVRYATSGDFDGDGKADYAVWRPFIGTWYVIPSNNPSNFLVQQWGVSTDIPVRGDFDGDGKTDFAVWRPSTGTWYVIPSKTPNNFLVQQWGASGDTPVPGDYDGDGKTDFAVWRPSNGTWYVIPSSNPSNFIVQQWGLSGDIPVPGDYDGDGKTDFAVWRPSNGTWYVIPSKTPSSFLVQQWGVNGDKPVPGDYDGDGKTDFAVWRPSNGTWYIIPSSKPSNFLVQQWGVSTDIPTPADYDGDRKTDFAVWRPSNGTWYVIPSSAPTNFSVTQWGTNGDVPVQKPIGQ